MDLERFIAALGVDEVVNAAPAAPVDVSELAYDTRAVGAGHALLLRARRDARRARVRADGGRARRRRARRRAAASTSRCRSSSCPTCAPRCRAAATLFFGDPTARARRRRGHRARTGRRRPRSCCTRSSQADGRQAGLLTNIERRVGGESAADRAQHARGDRPAAALPRRWSTPATRACVMEATSIAQAQGRLAGTRFAVLVFTNLTQDHLDFHGSMEAYFEAKRALFDAGRPRRRQRRRRVRPPARGRASRRDHLRRRLATRSTGSTLRLPRRASTARTRSAPRSPRARSASATTRSGAGSSRSPACPGRFEPIDEGQPFTVIVDYAHTPDSLDNVLRAARGLGDGKLVVVFGAGGDRDRDEAAADGPRRRRAGRPRDPHLRQPARRGAGRDRRRGRRRRARRARDRARPPRRDRARARRRAAGRRRRDRRPRRRARAGARDREDPLRRPRRRSRGPAAGASPS